MAITVRVTRVDELHQLPDSGVQAAHRASGLITLPDRLFHVLKWVALILVLFILSHVAWQMVM